MLGDTILIICLKKPANNVCVVSVCPYSCFGDVVRQVIGGPEHLGWGSTALTGLYLGCRGRFASKDGLKNASFARRRRGWVRVLARRVSAILPRVPGMPLQTVHEDDAGSCQLTSRDLDQGLSYVLDSARPVTWRPAAERCKADATHF
jgi:hypothetical protein